MNSKYCFLPLALFILFSCFNPSLGHYKKKNNPPIQCNCSYINPPPSSSPTPPPSSSSSSSTSRSPSSSSPPPPSPSSSSPPPPSSSSSSTSLPSSSPPPPSSSSTSPPPSSSPPPPPPSSSQPPSPPSSSSSSSSSQPSSSSSSSSQPSSSSSSSPQQSSSSSSSSSSSVSASGSVQVSFKGSFNKIFAFGESYTDTGNAFLLGGLRSFLGALMSHSFYGSTTSFKNSNRLCDGRLVIDFLTEALGLPTLPPYKDTSLNFTFGANFAISGSTSLSADFFVKNKVSHHLMWKEIPETLQTQIDWFTKFLQGMECMVKGKNCKSELANTLFWIGEMGLNDYVRTFRSSVSTKLLTEMSVNHVCKLLKTMLDNGAKYVVVQGLPPTGCLPLDLFLAPKSDRDKMGCAASANTVIQAHNELLQKRIAEYRKLHTDCMIIFADYWSAYQAIITNPVKYGFQETHKACCGGSGLFNFNLNALCGLPLTSKCKDPSKYISWDGIHLTEAMHMHLSTLFFHEGYCKPSFAELIEHKKKNAC